MSLASGNCELVGCTASPIDQDQLIAQVAAANPHTIVVLNTGGPVTMPWLDQIQGLFEAWYPGQQDGNAIASLLFGDTNPSGHLTETFPRSLADTPLQSPQQYPGVNDPQGVPQSHYSEGMLVGYRWYDAKNIAPLFPFGYGLSYTSFSLGGLNVAAGGPSAGAGTTPTAATASITVSNTGQRSGAAVPQMYIAAPAATGEPPKQLEGFSHVDLQAGQSVRTSFPITDRALSYWSSAAHGWRVARGCYTVMVGSDERDIAAHAVIAVNGAACPGAVARITAGDANVAGCAAPRGRLSGSHLGPVALGMTRARIRRLLNGRVQRRLRDMDFYCLAGTGGLRAGYLSARRLAALPRHLRRTERGRAVVLLTANRAYRLGRVRPGDSLASARRRLRLRLAYTIGRNHWYLTGGRRVRGVLKVQGGHALEIGIADGRLVTSRAAGRRLLAGFR